MRFIDRQYQENPVFERDEKSKIEEDTWLKWADDTLVRALPPLIYRNLSDAIKAFDYITREGKFSWLQQRTIKYSGAFVMTLVAKKSAKSQGITNPERHLEACLNEWSRAVGDGPYFGGQKPNGADLAVYGILKSIEGMPAFSILENNSGVYEWYQRVEGTALMAA
jgi:microsomal prostaglandin-E synthase 2